MTSISVPLGCEATDAQVIAASRSSPVEFAVIFDRHFTTVHRYLSRRVGETVADDLASETFIAALGKLAGYDQTYASARPWLLGIATNLIRNHRRDEARLFRAVQRSGAAAGVDHADDLAGMVAARVSAQAATAPLASTLAAMSDGDRDVLLLYAWGALTYDEIATALSIPVGTVRSRLHRSRAQLRQALELADVARRDHEGARL